MSDYGEVPTFTPTWDEFKDFSLYISKIAPICKEIGLARIIPPECYNPRKKSYKELLKNISIPTPIKQVVHGKKGFFQQINIEQPAMTVSEFEKMAKRMDCETDGISSDEIERKFWKNLQFQPPIYGADMIGTLSDEDLNAWNLRNLGTILSPANLGGNLPGVTVPYLYFGMWKAMFAWHTEDLDLYSINYLHYGKPKRWYCIPPKEGEKFERAAAAYFPALRKECKAFLRHKTSIINPRILAKQDYLSVFSCEQEAGQFMITFPYAYHAGFNVGYNCAESVNFAIDDWIEFGWKASRCTCSDSVRIDMPMFLARYELHKEHGEDFDITEKILLKKIEEINQKRNKNITNKKRKRAGSAKPPNKKQRLLEKHLEELLTPKSEWKNRNDLEFASSLIAPNKILITYKKIKL